MLITISRYTNYKHKPLFPCIFTPSFSEWFWGGMSIFPWIKIIIFSSSFVRSECIFICPIKNITHKKALQLGYIHFFHCLSYGIIRKTKRSDFPERSVCFFKTKRSMRVLSCGSTRVLPFLRNSLSLPGTF